MKIIKFDYCKISFSSLTYIRIKIVYFRVNTTTAKALYQKLFNHLSPRLERNQRRSDEFVTLPPSTCISRDTWKDVQDQWRNFFESIDRSINPRSNGQLVLTAKVVWQVVSTPSQHLHRLWRKTLLLTNGDSRSLHQIVHYYWTFRWHLREIHEDHPGDYNYRQFNRRGVATAGYQKCRLLHIKGWDELVMLHLRHLSPHDIAFLEGLLNFSVAGLNEKIYCIT